jgi:hypothetical protein
MQSIQVLKLILQKVSHTFYSIILICFISLNLNAQTIVDIKEFETLDDGIVIHRMNLDNVTSPLQSQLVFDNVNNNYSWYDISNNKWHTVFKGFLNISNFLGGSINYSIDPNVAYNNTGIGVNALNNLITGHSNTAIGYSALDANISGYWNVAVGSSALALNTSGYNNTAVGPGCLLRNTTGSNNIGIGFFSMESNTTGSNNIGIGDLALGDNTTGFRNIGLGGSALDANTTGIENIAIGYFSMEKNTTGRSNTALGAFALRENLTADFNTAIGTVSLENNTIGIENTAVGRSSLRENISGSLNVAAGRSALLNNETGNNNAALGTRAMFSNVSGDSNISIGDSSLYNNILGNGNVALGSFAGFNELGSNKLYIENSKVGSTEALIYGEFDTDIVRINGKVGVQSVPGNYPMKVKQLGVFGLDIENSTGSDDWELYTLNTGELTLYANGSNVGNFDKTTGAYSATSDRRLKENIKESKDMLSRVKSLGLAKSYTYKSDVEQNPQIGFIAQDLEKVFPEFVNVPGPNSEREQVYTVNYAGLSAVAISAIVEQQEIIDMQNTKIDNQEKQIKIILERLEQLEDKHKEE